MADTKTAHTAQKAPTVPAPKSEAASNGEKKPKREKKVWKAIFPTAEEAVKEATSRTSGPRRAFNVEFQGKTYHVVSHNFMTVGTPLAEHLGMKATEIGKPPRAAKAASADTVLDMLKNLPEEERAKVQAQLGNLLKK